MFKFGRNLVVGQPWPECEIAKTQFFTVAIFAKRSVAGTGEEVQALDGVSLSASEGTLAALVGPDGAGKTTLLRLAAGLLDADGGELRVVGVDVARDPQQVQSRIGYMPQKFGLYEDLSVQENLDLYADLHGVTRGGAGRAVSAAYGA